MIVNIWTIVKVDIWTGTVNNEAINHKPNFGLRFPNVSCPSPVFQDNYHLDMYFPESSHNSIITTHQQFPEANNWNSYISPD